MADQKPKPKQLLWKRWIKWIALVFIIGLVVSWYFIAYNEMRFSDHEVSDYFNQANTAFEIDYIPYEDDRLRLIRTGMPIHKAEKAIIFLHGAPGASDSFYSYQIDSTLLRHAHLVSFDRPGYGYSNYGVPLTGIKDQAEVVYQIMDHLNIENFILVSHSYGCAIAGVVALERAELIDANIMLCPVIDPLKEIIFFVSSWPSNRILKHFFSGAMQVASYVKMVHADELIGIEPLWNETEVPTLVMHGKKDWIAPVENANYLKGKISKELLTVEIDETASHFIPWTQQAKVIQKILHFL